MKRSLPLASLILSALVLTGHDAGAQDRRQPQELDLQGSIDAVFGDIVTGLSYYPFYNVAGFLGMSTDPQLRRDGDGNPAIEHLSLAGGTGVSRIMFSPSGGQVLGFGGNTAYLWNLAQRTAPPLAFEGHGAAITSAAFFPDEGELATGAEDGSVRIWNADATLVMELTHGGAIRAIAYSADGTGLATASADGTVKLWDASGSETANLAGHGSGAVSVTFSADGQTIATRDGNGIVRLWQMDGSQLGDDLPGARTAQSFSPDGGFLITESGTGDLSLVALADRAETAVATPAGGLLVDWSVSGEGEELQIHTLASDGMTRTFGADGTETESAPHPLLTESDLSDLEGNGGSHGFSADGTHLVEAPSDGEATVWEWFVRDPAGNVVTPRIPFVVLWLVVAAVLFTLFMKFVNLRMFKHALAVVRGKFSNPADQGEVTHFQALSSALSATVGLGNIAGVAIAVSIGGPGATFWMIVAGLLGMTLKFTECTLGQKFRKIDENGRVSGGPMHYLKDGLAQKGLAVIGIPLTIVFSVFCIGGSLAGGNSFQVNQSLTILKEQVPFFADNGWVYGLIMAFFVGIVIIGGIKRIAQTAEKIVPTMCTIYVLAALAIVISNLGAVPGAIGEIFGGALTGDAIYGGAIGALITGFQRAAFSNEAGVGSAAIAHSAAKTPYAVREGIVALLEPFIDTVVVCTMTALVIIITGVYDAERFPEYAEFVVGNQGAALTSVAFASVFAWFPWILMIAVTLFAYSTMISWFYYGERCWTNLFGERSSIYFKVLFLVFVVLGSVITATNVLGFGDLMILLMAFPNIAGLYFLGSIVKRDLIEYEGKLKSGDMPTYK
jgi:AGCS family alanine or glycine:cation symporter